MAEERARSELEAANLALSHLREPPIASFAETSHRARVVAKHFGSVRDEVLEGGRWNFATTWVTPARDPVDSLGNLVKRYPLPADCVKVRFVRDLGADDWAVEAVNTASIDPATLIKVLVTNADTPVVCYTRRVTNVALWDATFLRAFKLALAGAIGPEVARSTTAGEKADAAADVIRDRASVRDAREQAPSRISRDTDWIAARRGRRFR